MEGAIVFRGDSGWKHAVICGRGESLWRGEIIPFAFEATCGDVEFDMSRGAETRFQLRKVHMHEQYCKPIDCVAIVLVNGCNLKLSLSSSFSPKPKCCYGSLFFTGAMMTGELNFTIPEFVHSSQSDQIGPVPQDSSLSTPT